jgi:hypothetical protein
MARCQFGNLLCHATAATGRSGDGTPTGWAMSLGRRARGQRDFDKLPAAHHAPGGIRLTASGEQPPAVS